MRSLRWLGLVLGVSVACRSGAGREGLHAPRATAGAPAIPIPTATLSGSSDPAFPPHVAYVAGFLPLASTGVDQFHARHPTYDGRGVLIGILDSGIDPGVEGLGLTSSGTPKILDLRDFAGEGAVALRPVTPRTDGTVRVEDRTLMGAGRIARVTGSNVWFAGVLRELSLGKLPAADLNGNGTNTDVFPVIVVKATDGWVAFIDTNLDGSFEDEKPLHDYYQARETTALGSKPLTIAANFDEAHGLPLLNFVFDNSSHGTHVAGIAAGHNLFGVPGFDGVAPGAQLLGLKISNNARGGVSVTGSMQRAMTYAARFAEARGLPLVLNLSFGLGNEFEGRAVIDSIINAFLLAHPSVVFAISAGNDGPGLSTLGFPASADLALSTGAAFPGAFARSPYAAGPPVRDAIGWWSSRGGEVAKPDIITPGVAFSTVPRFDTGDEVKGGTSMAAPHAAGLASRLISAMLQEHRNVSAAEVIQALRISGRRFPGATVLDQGAGEPQLETAYRWLEAGHQGSQYLVRTAGGTSAAFRRDGLAGPGDTVEVFRVRHIGGLRAAQFLLRSNARWLSVPETVTAAPFETAIPVRYAAPAILAPGLYLGSVTAWNPSDTLAGPLFTLVNTVIVPFDLTVQRLTDEARQIGPSKVQRYFLRAGQPGVTLRATISLTDSLQQRATARLYEPNGQPFRDADETPLGMRDPGSAQFVVRSEDLVPGVYELDVFAPPLAGVTATVRAELAPLTFGESSEGLELANTGTRTVAGRVGVTLLGAGRDFDVAGRGAVAETLTVRVPEWAAAVLIDVTMPRVQWNDFTGFAMTEFDSSGQQVGQNSLSYSSGRQRLMLNAGLRRRPLAVELFPAFARADAAHPWRATVRFRFLLAREQAVGDGKDLSVVPGGRTTFQVPALPPLTVPEGFTPFVEVRVRPPRAPATSAVRRVLTGHR
jgi:subtilisin family serine protease